MMIGKSKFRERRGERSFTLIETLVALTMMTTVILNVVGAQGSAIYNADYGRRITEAMWLAKGVMSKVEYRWHNQPLKELESSGNLKQQPFKEQEWNQPADSDYTYNLRIEEWKFPLFELLESGGPSDEEEGDSDGEGAGFPIKDLAKQFLGDHILKVAFVEVFWPEGARQNSVTLTYLLTNQRKMDEALLSQKAAYDSMMKAVAAEYSPKKKKKSIKTEAACKKNNTKNVWNKKDRKCRNAEGKEVFDFVKAKKKD